MGGSIVAATLSSAISGHGWLPRSAVRPFLALASPTDLLAVWGRPAAPPSLYWSVTVMLALCVVSAMGWSLLRRRGSDDSKDGFVGSTDPVEVRRAASAKTLLRRGRALRPSLSQPEVADVGFRRGASKGIACHCAVEDSAVVLGPPQSGKARCEIAAFRYRVLHVAARLTRGARQTRLRIDQTWRWATQTASGFHRIRTAFG